MNIIISIRLFTIFIDDRTIDEKVREVIDSKLIFCQNYNLLMYFKLVITKSKASPIPIVKEAKKFLESKSSDSNDELFDIKEIQRDF